MNKFALIAQKYDTQERVNLAQIVLSELDKHLNNTTEKTLLDYGCGTGLVGLELAKKFREITLIDSVQQMITIVNKKIVDKKIINAYSLCLDFTKDTITKKYDFVLLSLVLLHIPDTNKILNRLRNCLKENGTLLIIDFDYVPNMDTSDGVHNGFKHSELKQLLLKNNYNNVTIENFRFEKNVFKKQDATLFICKASYL